MRYEPFVNAGKIAKGHISRCASRNLCLGEKERFFRGESCGLVIFFPYRSESWRNKHHPRIQIYRVVPALFFDQRRISRANFSGAKQDQETVGQRIIECIRAQSRRSLFFFIEITNFIDSRRHLPHLCNSFLDNEEHLLRLKRCIR